MKNKLLKGLTAGILVSSIALGGLQYYRQKEFNRYLNITKKVFNIEENQVRDVQYENFLEKLENKLASPFTLAKNTSFISKIWGRNDENRIVVYLPLTLDKRYICSGYSYSYRGDWYVDINLLKLKKEAKDLKKWGERAEKEDWPMGPEIAPLCVVMEFKYYQELKKQFKSEKEFIEKYIETELNKLKNHEPEHKYSRKDQIRPILSELAHASTSIELYSIFGDLDIGCRKEILDLFKGKGYTIEKLSTASLEEVATATKEIYVELKK